DTWGQQEAVPVAQEVPAAPQEAERGDPEPVKRAAPEVWFNCRRCKMKVRRQGECPVCDRAPVGVLEEEPAAVGVAPHSLELEEPLRPARPAVEDEDDGNPYLLADRLLPRLPKCQKELAGEGAVMCVKCGYDLRTRKKAVRTFTPLDVVWDTNVPLQHRLMWFGLGQAGVLALGVMVVSAGAEASSFFLSWPLF